MKTKLFTLFFVLVACVGISHASITVRLNPESCSSWSTVRLWAWTSEGNLFNAWPGIVINKDATGWYAYTFDENITSVNIIWNNGTDQTVNIESVSKSTYYALNKTSGTDITVESYSLLFSFESKYDYLDNRMNYYASVLPPIYKGEYSGDVIIPSYITYLGEVYSVTSIGDSAFFYCRNLTSVTIPNTVTSIGYNAFWGCTGLTSPVYNANCFAFLPYAYSGSYTIPDGIKQIAGAAFDGRKSLTSITIPNSVTSIGNDAFYSCSGLTSVTIGNSVNSIGNKAFLGCTGLTSVTIPNSVNSIGYAAFWGCSGLTNVTIGNSVNSIGNNAFEGCTGLTSVTIPNSVTSIGDGAFNACSNLTSVTLNSDSIVSNSYTPEIRIKNFFGEQVLEYIIGDSVTSIGDYAFWGCSGLTSVIIPSSVTSIGDGAFYGCHSLTSVEIPNSVLSIGNRTFDSCSGLTSVTIPNSVISIGSWAFELCSGLTSVIIGSGVTSIGDAVFWGCSGLTSPVYNANCFAYLPHAYSGSYTIPDGIKQIAGAAFYYCDSLTSITIPKSVTSIGDRAFYNCTSLTEVTCLGETPATLEGSDLFSHHTRIYVPCGTRLTYLSAWGNLFWICYAPTPYKLEVNVNDNIMGQVTNSDFSICDTVGNLTAIANTGYYFVQWNDGVTDNPRTIKLTQDTTFTAEFAPSTNIMTCSEARDAALSGSTDEVSVVGYVTEIIYAWDATYQNISFWMADTKNGGRVFEAYCVKCASQAEAPLVGDKVKVSGTLKLYNSTTPEIAAGGTFEILERAPSDEEYEKMYLFGEIASGEWSAALPMEKISKNIFQVVETLIHPTSYFCFVYDMGDSSWDYINTHRYGGENNNLLTPGITGSLVAGEKCFTAVAGTYTFSVDMNSMTAWIEDYTVDIDNVQSDKVQCTKVLRNGQIFILRGDKTYTVTGQEVR